jgi:hypothetical protein
MNLNVWENTNFKCQARILELSINLFPSPGISKLGDFRKLSAQFEIAKFAALEKVKTRQLFFIACLRNIHSLAPCLVASHPLFLFRSQRCCYCMTRQQSHANPNLGRICNKKITSLLKNNDTQINVKNSSPDAKKQRSALLHLWDDKHGWNVWAVVDK